MSEAKDARLSGRWTCTPITPLYYLFFPICANPLPNQKNLSKPLLAVSHLGQFRHYDWRLYGAQYADNPVMLQQRCSMTV